MDTKYKCTGNVALLVLLIISILVIIGLIFVRKIPHQRILEYGKILISWPGAIILVSILIFYFIRIDLYGRRKTIIIHEKDPDVTGFINIKEKTDDGNLVIGLKENYKIRDGDAVVSKALIMDYYDLKKEVKSLKLELAKYQEKLLEK